MAEIDVNVFIKRFKKLQDYWKKADKWQSLKAFVVCNGQASEDEFRYLKSRSLQLWLFGYELPGTIIAFKQDAIQFITTSKKAEVLQPLVPEVQSQLQVDIKFIIKSKTDDVNQLVQQLINFIKEGGSKNVGHLPKEQHQGDLVEKWREAFEREVPNLVDVTALLAHVMAIKDADEIIKLKYSSQLASKVLGDYTVKQIEDALDQEKRVKHSKLSDATEKVIQDPQRLKIRIKAENVDIAYPPIIQSGGKYELKPGAMSDDELLYYESGVIYCAVGAKYLQYCSNVARTYLIEGTKDQESEYNAILKAQEAAIATLKDGTPLRDVHAIVINTLKGEGKEHLVQHLQRSCGFGIGLELKDSIFSINATNNEVAKSGMIFNIAVNCENMQLSEETKEKARTYAMGLSDTVLVQPNGQGAQILTDLAPKENVFYSLNGDDQEQQADIKVEEEHHLENGKQNGNKGYEMRNRDLRSVNPDYQNTEFARQEKQKRLVEQKNRETTERLLKQKGQGGDDQQQRNGRSIVDIVAYKSFEKIPFSRDLIVQIDREMECIFFPVYGVLVPFHVVTIKNITSNQDGDHAYVRINFNYSGSYEAAIKFPQLVMLKELSFRFSDSKRAQRLVQETRTLRQQVIQRDKEIADRATLVKQEKLIRGKRIFRLPDVWIRPTFGVKGRRLPGILEAHQNGFRYATNKAGEECEVMYRNIKHAFFQPAENDQITLIHFNLINPIMLGKNKVSNVQFYAEVMEVVQTLEGRKNYGYDPDEIEEEQRERARRMKINEDFQQFVNRVQELWERELGDFDLEFDIPFRDLGFDGVPHKSSVQVVPTSRCLVQLIEPPYFIVTLSEVEIVALERASLNLKNFDMAIVFKDFSRDVVKVDSIPTKSLDYIKGWLNDSNIKYYELRSNLVWKEVLKSIVNDPKGFAENNGWEFLDIDKSDSEANSDEEEGDEEFSPGEGVSEEEEEEEEDDDSEFADSDEDESLEDEEEGGEANEEYSDEDDRGKDWDELEAEAKRQDAENDFEDEEEDQPKRKRKPMPAQANKKFKR